ncbi:MAG: hypothetical protein ACI8TQ_004071 [Planctomycetota bacterium]|jgi:hypothetical protein
MRIGWPHNWATIERRGGPSSEAASLTRPGPGWSLAIEAGMMGSLIQRRGLYSVFE